MAEVGNVDSDPIRVKSTTGIEPAGTVIAVVRTVTSSDVVAASIP